MSQASGPAVSKQPLVAAALNGDIDLLQKLLVQRRDEIEVKDRAYGTPLHAAIINNHIEAVAILLAAGADPLALAPDDEGEEAFTALVLAAKLGKRDIVKLLWERNPGLIARSEYPSRSALELACTYGHKEVVQDLMEWWKDWGVDRDGQELVDRALLRAAGRWRSNVIEVLTELHEYTQEALDAALLKAAGMKFLDYEFQLPYEHTDRLQQVSTLGALLHAGANTDTQKNGQHALHTAVRNLETIEGFRYLIENGGDVNVKNTQGDTLLCAALQPVPNRRSHFRSLTPNTEAVTILLDAGVDVDAKGWLERAPLHIIAYFGPLSLYETIRERASNLWPTTSQGETLLHRACAGNQLEIVQSLLLEGVDVDVNKPTTDGWTALLFAVQSTRSNFDDILKIVQTLLDHGANALAATNLGWTPLHRCADIRRAGVDVGVLAELLITHGANLEAIAAVSVNPTSKYDHGHGFHQSATPERYHIEAGRQARTILGETPLHWATDAGSLDVVKTLLRHGANPSAKNSDGATPALRAAKSKQSDFEYSISNRQKVIKALLNADPKADDTFNTEDHTNTSIHSWSRLHKLSENWKEW